MSELDAYLEAIARRARGARSDRFAIELRDHVADALADERAAGRDDGEAEALVLERLGSPDETVAAWKAHARRSRARTRRRVAGTTLLAACAAALAVVQLAAGHRPAHDPCMPPHDAAHCVQPHTR